MSSYNERFKFDDPLGPRSASKSTRYRAKRKRVCEAVDLSLSQPEGEGDHERIEYPQQGLRPISYVGSTVIDMAVDAEESETEENETGEHQISESSMVPPLVRDNVPHVDEDFLLEDNILSLSRSDTLLYEGSRLNVTASSVLIQKFVMRHNITKEALADLLKLLKIHCPSPNLCLSSVYQFKKQFPELEYKPILHYFCNQCVTDVANCEECVCGASLSQLNSVSSFIELPLDQQLKAILERKSHNYSVLNNHAIITIYFRRWCNGNDIESFQVAKQNHRQLC